MRDQAEKLRLTLMQDGGGAELAFKELIRSELSAVFSQYMTVDDIKVEVCEDGVLVKVFGGDIKRVGFLCE